VLPPEAGKLVGSGDAGRVLQVLEGHGLWLARADRDRVLLASLESAIAEVESRLGPDVAQWQWGRLHTAVFEHPLASRVDENARRRLTVGTWPLGGSSFTPMAASYRAADYQLTSGASFRMVVDVGDWDRSVVINTPGQSGNPSSPHYRDLAPMWAGGRYFPLAYSREAVERHGRTLLELMPAQ
jgi:penicillin amidase